MELPTLIPKVEAVNFHLPINQSSKCVINPGDIIAGKYRAISMLGEGQFAVVWAVETSDGNRIAIKIYRLGKTQMEYFCNEVSVLNKLLQYSTAVVEGASPNLIGYQGFTMHFDLDNDFSPRVHPCVLMNMGGDHVLRLLRRFRSEYKSGLPIRVVKKFMRHMLNGLDFMHQCGLIHTDIKPNNLLMDRSVADAESDIDATNLLVSDLGSATPDDNLFSMHIGTFGYIAPEVLLEERYTSAVDIWAAFAVCFELITGDLLFDIDNECGIKYGTDVDDDLARKNNKTVKVSADEESKRLSGDEMDEKMIDAWIQQCQEENECMDETGAVIPTGRPSKWQTTDHAWPWLENKATDDKKPVDKRNTGASSSDSSDEEDKAATTYKYLLLTEKLLGNAPKEFSGGAREYYNARGKLKNNPNINHTPIGQFLRENYKLEEQECNDIQEFLLLGLQYMPEQRITAADALNHQWLKE